MCYRLFVQHNIRLLCIGVFVIVLCMRVYGVRYLYVASECDSASSTLFLRKTTLPIPAVTFHRVQYICKTVVHKVRAALLTANVEKRSYEQQPSFNQPITSTGLCQIQMLIR